jgi:phosphoglycerate dehydrogenase-like enzyme
MKVTYVLRDAGVAARTPRGWRSAVVAAREDASYTEDALQEVEDADVLVVGIDPVTEAFLARARRVRLVQRLGVGHDNIDLEAAAAFGIPVATMPDFNAESVAEHTIMFILALLRRAFESTLLMKAGRWPVRDVVAKGIFDLRGKTLGVIGLGAIGQAVASRAKPFEVDICYHDIRRAPPSVEERLGVAFASLHDLLRTADVVTIHAPLTPSTSRLLGRAELRLMKPTALLVNTARGAIVDEQALVEALEQGIIAGAGLDVYADEPLDPRHPLRRCPNVLLTPHTAGQTREAMEKSASPGGRSRSIGLVWADAASRARACAAQSDRPLIRLD